MFASHGQENGCKVAEFLPIIDDEEFQRQRLVRYYSRVGFQVIKSRTLWIFPIHLSGVDAGLFMREDIMDALIRNWADLLKFVKERASV
jgi:hypothetical protein